MAKTSTVLTTPVPNYQAKPHVYTSEQTAQIDELRAYAETLLLPPSESYHANEVAWLADPGCVPRYMRAGKWKMDDAKRRIAGTITWRREFKPDLISADEVKIEAETGKIILNGFDLEGRPILYMRPGRENTPTSDRQLLHLIFHLERAIDFLPPGQETVAIIVDYKSATASTNPSISTARKVLNILQQHYVERLGRAIVVNLPFLLNFFYKGISPFLDPVTRDKMKFNPSLLDLVPAEQLDASFDGGMYEYEFEPNSYWEQICRYSGVRGDGTRFKRGEESSGEKPIVLAEPKVEEATVAQPEAIKATA